MDSLDRLTTLARTSKICNGQRSANKEQHLSYAKLQAPPLNRHQDGKYVQRMRRQSGNLEPNATKQNVNKDKNDRTRNKHDNTYMQNMNMQQGNVNPNESKQHVSNNNTNHQPFMLHNMQTEWRQIKPLTTQAKQNKYDSMQTEWRQIEPFTAQAKQNKYDLGRQSWMKSDTTPTNMPTNINQRK